MRFRCLEPPNPPIWIAGASWSVEIQMLMPGASKSSDLGRRRLLERKPQQQASAQQHNINMPRFGPPTRAKR